MLGKNGVDGIKTGHTEEGGYGIVASALNKEGTRLIAVLNGLSSMNERKEEAENLLNYGFINFSTKHFYKKGDIIQNVNVKYGIEDILAITTLEDVVAVVPRTYSEKDLDIQIHTNSLEAPILEGQEVGWLIVHDLKKKEEIKRYNLVASKAIEESGIFKRLMQWIKYSISLFV